MSKVADLQQTLRTSMGGAAADALADFLEAVTTKRVPVPLQTLFESDGTNTVAALGPGTTPVLDLANGDTDGALDVVWAASNSDAVIFNLPVPDIDVDQNLKVYVRVKAGGSTDTPTIAADSYFNEGDTKVEDASAAISDAVQELAITVAAADIPLGTKTFTCELTPGAHTTDTVVVTALWVEYTSVVKV